jgi:hypothetical protein
MVYTHIYLTLSCFGLSVHLLLTFFTFLNQPIIFIPSSVLPGRLAYGSRDPGMNPNTGAQFVQQRKN